ncbi:hypothetical protein HYU22_01880 [Candidatus Woesearchaeota archaeon]|nr:hypothetical protein [Candidatus Woesearchaeota archaeon]
MALPSDIFYYNRWRGVEVREIHDCFKALGLKELKQLKEGDTIRLDLEPYHLNGKVYGYSAVKIKGVHRKSGSKEYTYESPSCQGGFTIDKHYRPRMWKLVNQSKLEALIVQYGDRITGVYSREEKDSFNVFAALAEMY